MVKIGSLCSGIGGLELGLERAGLGHTVWQAEIDPHANEVLARHWDVPNLGDFRDRTLPDCDVLCGGFPCQPVSSAGQRKGTQDERWLFDDICDAIGRMGTRPRLLVFENVRGLLTANSGDAMARVVHGLARLGYVGRYGTLRASDVGAPHRRERVFIVAADASDLGHEWGRRPRDGRPGPADSSDTTADTECIGSHREADDARWRQPDTGGLSARSAIRGRRTPSSGRATAADAASPERRSTQHDPLLAATRPAAEPRERHRTGIDWGSYAAAIGRWERFHGPAPHPTTDGRLNPAFVEWMMGFPPGWVDGLTRTAALRCLGNAVVPQVAEVIGRHNHPAYHKVDPTTPADTTPPPVVA